MQSLTIKILWDAFIHTLEASSSIINSNIYDLSHWWFCNRDVHISHCRGAWGVAPAGHVVVYSALKITPPKSVVINFLMLPTEPQLHPLPNPRPSPRSRPRPSLYMRYKTKLNWGTYQRIKAHIKLSKVKWSCCYDNKMLLCLPGLCCYDNRYCLAGCSCKWKLNK